jgi:hypothetical protein
LRCHWAPYKKGYSTWSLEAFDPTRNQHVKEALIEKKNKKSFKLIFLYFICNSNKLNKMFNVFKFGPLKIRKSKSKVTYNKTSGLNLKLISIFSITSSQHIYGFVPTSHTQIQI